LVLFGSQYATASASLTVTTKIAHSFELEPSIDTSLTNTQGAFAAVAMGHLNQPLNTFWQLFFQPAGTSKWTLVTPPGVASNGGLVIATSQDHALLAGFRPTNFLTYSPVSMTDNEGRAWSVGALPGGLLGRTDALGMSGSGELAALIDDPKPEVVTSDGSLSDWAPLISQERLSSTTSGARCGIEDLTSVTFNNAGDVIVGATCAHPGVVGIFENTGSSWHLLGPSLSPSLSRDNIEVINFSQERGVMTALLATHGPSRTSLVGAWQLAGTRWGTSPPFVLRHSTTVTSTGPDGRGGFFVLTSNGSLRPSLELLGGPGTAWDQLPLTPRGTATVVFSATGSIESLTANGDSFQSWILNAHAKVWDATQSILVPILYGSSS
jgi:hypothetical protein